MRNLNKLFGIFLVGIIFYFFWIPKSFCIENKVKLFYEIYYGPFKVGESEIYLTSEKYTAIVYSTGLAEKIFPFYAKWETWVDKKGYPKTVVIYSKERGKERKRAIYFKREEGKVVYQELLPKYKEPENISLDFPIYDELSSFVASFYIDYMKSPQRYLPLFIKKKKEYVKVSFVERKICEFEEAKKECLYIRVYLPKKSELLERASEVDMFLWDEKRVPLELRGKLPIFGNLVGKLRKINAF